jgi:hypothetical protein
MKILNKLATFMLVFAVVGCVGNEQPVKEDEVMEATLTYRVSFLDANDKVVIQANGENVVQQIQALIADKRVMMKKILPVFDSKIIIENGDSRQEWLYVKPNYIRLNSKQDKTIYELNGKSDLLKSLKSMSQQK